MLRPLPIVLVISIVTLAYLWVSDKQEQRSSDSPIPGIAITEKPAAPALQSEKTESVEYIAGLVDGSGASRAVPESFFENTPASLEGTPKPVRLGVDESGALVVDLRVRHLFEYYLMATGEEPLEDIVLRIRHELVTQLEPTAYEQAVALLEGYLQYRNNIGVISNSYAPQAGPNGPDLPLILEMKRAVRESRTEFLPESANATFFAAEDEYDQYMFGRAAILIDGTLSDNEKQEQLALLDLNSPADQVSGHHDAKALSAASSEVNRLRAAGAGEDEVYAFREQALGAEVAGRLSALDTQRQQWQSRVDAYRVELEVLESASEYPGQERARMIEELREQHFDEREILRVRGLDSQRAMTPEAE